MNKKIQAPFFSFANATSDDPPHHDTTTPFFAHLSKLLTGDTALER